MLIKDNLLYTNPNLMFKINKDGKIDEIEKFTTPSEYEKYFVKEQVDPHK